MSATTTVSALQAALAAENAAIFGYGVAGAHLSGSSLAAAVQDWTGHNEARDTLDRLQQGRGGGRVSGLRQVVRHMHRKADSVAAVGPEAVLQQCRGAAWHLELVDQRTVTLDQLGMGRMRGHAQLPGVRYAHRDRRIVHTHPQVRALGWRITSGAAGCAAMVVAAALFLLHRDEPHRFLLSTALLLMGFIVLLHGRFLQLFRGRLLLTSMSLANREQKLRSVFESAPDAMLVLDDQMFCHEANPAALKLFGVGHEQLVGRSISLFGIDRAELLRSWERLVAGHVRGRLEMMRADGAKLAAEFTATSHILPGRHLLVLQDTTQRLQAEQVKSQSLMVTKAALREANALRNATLALTQSPHLNPVLDTLLITLRSLIPYETAQVLLLETPTRLFLAREVSGDLGRTPHCPEILDSAEFPALQGALVPGEGLLIRDTQLDDGWTGFAQTYGARSWLGVPLFARDQVIGLLGVMHAQPEQFTAEHLRLAGCLAIPATVAIENARLYERAEIYSAELEKRLADVRRMEQVLKLREDWQRQREIN